MQLRRIVIVSSIVLFAVIAISVVRGKSPDQQGIIPVNLLAPPTKEQIRDVPGTIDGSKTPNLVPDRVAYFVLFGAIPEQKKDEESIKLVRDYVSHILGGCSKCKSVKDKGDFEQAKKDHNQDIDGFLGLVTDFRQRVGVLDRQVIGIKNRHWPNPSPAIMAQLTQLQRQREAIVDELTRYLPFRLQGEGVNGIKDRISKIKDKIKMIPAPTGPPGTLGWKQGSPSGHIH